MKLFSKSFFLALFAITSLHFSFAQETYDTSGAPVRFAFTFKKGDSFRILSTVNEDVYVNMRLNHRAEIINRISTQITDVDQSGNGVHESTFMTTEHAESTRGANSFSWGEEYKSIFTRTPLGVYSIDDQYFMPTVRDVPVFPDYAVKPGDTWMADGHEAHDLRKSFGLETPYKVPFTAQYTYLGTVGKEKREVRQMSYVASSLTQKRNNEVVSRTGSNTLHVFRVKYSLYMEAPERRPSDLIDPYSDYPQTTMGFSDELVYWDAEKGAIDHYTETFRILIESAYGVMYEFRGTAHAEVTDFLRTSTEDNIRAVQQQIEELGLKNVNVKKTDKGLTLSIENIQFKAESSELLPSEKAKLDHIIDILEAFPDNDILVAGHTAYSTNGRDSQVLSEARADSVAEYLIEHGIHDRYHVFTQGFGHSQPIGSNNTEEGKAKNRRVEITIMDK